MNEDNDVEADEDGDEEGDDGGASGGGGGGVVADGEYVVDEVMECPEKYSLDYRALMLNNNTRNM